MTNPRRLARLGAGVIEDAVEPERNELGSLVGHRAPHDVIHGARPAADPDAARRTEDVVVPAMALGVHVGMLVAGDDARFSEIFARRGLSIDFGGSWILPRRIGMHRAKELTLLADIIDADAAKEMGLVNRVLPDHELDAFTQDWADRLAAGPPIALAMSKRLLNNSFSVTLEEALDDEGLSQTVNFGTKDTVEAVMAFIEKRDPEFRGR